MGSAATPDVYQESRQTQEINKTQKEDKDHQHRTHPEDPYKLVKMAEAIASDEKPIQHVLPQALLSNHRVFVHVLKHLWCIVRA